MTSKTYTAQIHDHVAYPNYSIHDVFSVHRISKDFFSSYFNRPSDTLNLTGNCVNLRRTVNVNISQYNKA